MELERLKTIAMKFVRQKRPDLEDDFKGQLAQICTATVPYRITDTI